MYFGEFLVFSFSLIEILISLMRPEEELLLPLCIRSRSLQILESKVLEMMAEDIYQVVKPEMEARPDAGSSSKQRHGVCLQWLMRFTSTIPNCCLLFSSL